MATTKMGLALVRSKQTGLKELSTQVFEDKKDVRSRYPSQFYKIVEFPVVFDAQGWIQVRSESDEEG